MKPTLLFALVGSLLGQYQSCTAQQAIATMDSTTTTANTTVITGVISPYSSGEATLTNYDMISHAKTTIGTIQDSGTFTIPLVPDYIIQIKTAAQEFAATNTEGWELRFNTLATQFICDKIEMTYEHEDTILLGLPEPSISDKEGNEIGVLYAVSTAEIAQWLYSYGQEEPAVGFYLNWYYLEAEAYLSGSCSIPNYTGNGDENFMSTTTYNLQLQKGWNMIKTSIDALFTTEDGKKLPMQTTVSSTTSIPEKLQWEIVKSPN